MITSLRLRVDMRRLIDWVRSRWVSLAFAILVCWYGLATLPYLADFPVLEWAQNGIAAPAYKLATTGVYGNDLFTGFYHTETYNYEYMPLYPLLVALAFKLFGLGVVQGRLVSVLCGLATVALTFRLGKQLYDSTLGLLAAAILCVVRLGLAPNVSGVPLVDFARVLRYDIMVPVWVLAACNCFFWAHVHRRSIGYFGAGVLAGLAILSHLYGGFIIAVMVAVLVWRDGWRTLASRPIYLIAAGALLALLPWIFYISQDPAAYEGQMLRHVKRFEFFQLSFYLDNLRGEPHRYVSWTGGSITHPILWPRAGIWLVLAGVLITSVCLCMRLFRRRSLPDCLLLLALPLLAGLLAALESYKRSQYVVLLLPFLALEIAFAIITVWRWAAERRWLPIRVLLTGLVIAALWEGSQGVIHSWEVARMTTPYLQLTQQLGRPIPPEARILIAQPFWLGLAQYHARSINLAFVLSDPQYGYEHTPSMEQVMMRIDPEYVVEDYNPNTFANAPAQYNWAIAQWTMFLDYLAQHCQVIESLNTPDYGPIRVHQCAQ